MGVFQRRRVEAGAAQQSTASASSSDAGSVDRALSSKVPSVDTRSVLDSIGAVGSSGEDPEMSEEDELMMAGGDPSFLDDSLWSSPSSAKGSTGVEMGSSGEDPEGSEEDELMMAGGDPSFLDASLWSSPSSAKGSTGVEMGSSGEDPEM